jgi:hypothetical protein
LEWRGGRAVDCTGLENRRLRKRLVGSNPTLSAKKWAFRQVRPSVPVRSECFPGSVPRAREPWHHASMISRYPLLVCAAPFFLAACLFACSTPGNYRNDAAHEELLRTLRQCLAEIPISGDRDKDFISPCVSRDVSSLNGISRSRLIDALGPARFCMSQTELNFPEKDNCPFAQNPLWSFYRHAGSIDVGGGPQLICVSNKTTRCVTVEWRRTQ